MSRATSPRNRSDLVVRFTFPQIKGEKPGHSRHVGRLTGGPQFKAGDPVRQTGIYEVTHDREHRPAHDVVMLSGDVFPGCENCDQRVRFRLVRTAPYIFHDEDFENPDE